MENIEKLGWILIVLGSAGIIISLLIGREINFYKASDTKRWVAVALFFGGAALAIVGVSLLK